MTERTSDFTRELDEVANDGAEKEATGERIRWMTPKKID